MSNQETVPRREQEKWKWKVVARYERHAVSLGGSCPALKPTFSHWMAQFSLNIATRGSAGALAEEHKTHAKLRAYHPPSAHLGVLTIACQALRSSTASGVLTHSLSLPVSMLRSFLMWQSTFATLLAHKFITSIVTIWWPR